MKRKVKKLLLLLFQPDSWFFMLKMKAVDVLQVLPDANRQVVIESKKYSPIGDTIFLALSSHLDCFDVARPLSAIKKGALQKHTIKVNWAYVILRSAFWRTLMKKTRPKALVGIDMPNSLILAARSSGSTVIELYHGFGRGVSNDLYFSKYEKGLREHPDVIVVYDQQTFEALSERLPSSIRVELARNYWLDFVEQIGNSYFEEVRSRVFSSESPPLEKTVLISLQHGYDGTREHLSGILDNGLLAQDVIDAICLFPTTRFLIKPHPVQIMSFGWHKAHQMLLELESKHANVCFKGILGVDVISLLAISDGHITMSSGVIYDASFLNVPSLSLCPTMQSGGTMADAFEMPEEQGLLKRGSMNSDDTMVFLNQLEARHGSPKKLPSEGLPSAASIISRYVSYED